VAGTKECDVFRTITALALLASSAIAVTATAATTSDSDAVLAMAPWWEKVTVTVTGDGNTRSCRYESSLDPAANTDCDVSAPKPKVGESSGAKSEITRITFERRFSPGAEPASTKLEAGDKLLGGQVMALAIDARGQVKKCEVVAASSGVKPEYGCAEATAERFDASVGSSPKIAREAYMTILVYGHPEHMV
jgi:hypothetical protein